MRKRLIMAAIVVVLLFGFIAAAFFYFLSDKNIKSFLTARGETALGREFSIGTLDVDWGWPTVRVRTEEITLANIKGVDPSEAQMVDIGKMDFRIYLIPLFWGRVQMPELIITQPKIILDKINGNSNNWTISKLSKSGVVADAALPDDRHDFPVIGRLIVKDGLLTYRDREKDLKVTLSLDTATGKEVDERNFFTLKGNGILQKKEFELQAQGGSIDLLRDTNKPYPLQFNLQMGATQFSMKGTFQDPVKLSGIDSMLDVSGNDMADLFYLTAIPLPPTPPYTLSGKLIKINDVWNYDNFTGKVGDSDLAGSMTYDVSGDRGLVKADLVSNFLDIDDLGGFIGVAPSTRRGETVAPEQKEQAAAQAASSRILPDMNINLPRLRSTDMQVKLVATKINAPGWPITDMNVLFNLDNGLLKLDPLKFGVADGAIDGSIILNGREDVPSIQANLALKKLSLKGFFNNSRFEDLSSGRFGGRIDLNGKGKSLADALGTSNGRVTLTMSGGRISLLIIEAAGIDIAEAMPLLLGDDQTTDIRCAVGDFKVSNGLLSSDIFVFDTNDTNIEGEAVIDLRNETIDARIESHPKDVSPLSMRTPLRVTGRLKSPSISLEPGELSARGVGAAILGAVFLPAAVIPFIELGLGEDSNCRDLIGQARAATSGKN